VAEVAIVAKCAVSRRSFKFLVVFLVTAGRFVDYQSFRRFRIFVRQDPVRANPSWCS
jgi:hypothetical protein